MKRILLFLVFAVFLFATGCAPQGSGSAGGTPSAPSGGEGEAGGGIVGETVVFTVGGNTLTMTLAESEAAAALVQRLEEGAVTCTADDYGGFEKVGGLGFSLPRSDERLTAEAGDVMLYRGDQLVLFYGSNTYSYTRLGRFEGYSAAELRTLLCAGQGSVPVTLRLG